MNINVVKGYIYYASRYLKRFAKVITRPQIEIKGKKLLGQYLNTSQVGLRIDKCSGYLKFNIHDFPHLKEKRKKLMTLATKWLTEAEVRRPPDTRIRRDSTELPIKLLFTSDLIEHNDIVEFALSDEFLLPISVYLGQVPRLSELQVLWSPKNDTEVYSQKFHYDHKDTMEMKVFINLNDVDEDCGPLYFLPAKESSNFDLRVGYNQDRNSDELVYSACNKDYLNNNIGEAGSGLIIDTARCLHYGSRKNEKDRLLLLIGFVRPTCIKPRRKSTTLEPLRNELAEKFFKNDPVKHYALTVKGI